MIEVLSIITLIISLVSLIIIYILLKKITGTNLSELQTTFKLALEENSTKQERLIKDEFSRNREETNNAAKQTREELSGSFKLLNDSFFNRMIEVSNLQKSQLETFRETMNTLSRTIEDKMELFRDGMEKKLQNFQNEFSLSSKHSREELSGTLKSITDSLLKQLSETSQLQKNELKLFSEQLNKLTQTNEVKLDQLRDKVEERLINLQDSNTKKLDEMRATVDEKLQSTLEKRLGESFKLVSDRLEQVHKGLGEMQTLAIGVGDLKKVLSGVKTRGILGEYQLENILEQILSPEQYSKNVITKIGSKENVEFAIKLPGREKTEQTVWLPIDSKFPQEKYQYLLDAYESGNTERIDLANKELEKTIKLSAKDIRDKYLDPPNTTDFGIMFLPFEGLYAEIAKRPGMLEILQREYKITVAGPSNLSAFLNSLQMGFRTLAIEKRTSEVWSLLGAVKTEFGKFGDVLDKTQKKLQEATNTIDEASKRTRSIERRLRDVQVLPVAGQPALLDESNLQDTPE
ncbi:MAG: DNA recombination protein RmuC [Ignavibacteriales bacterium]|nr:DNA recombination protein RmuC [Ignavibacteriales bacterium]